MKLKLASLGLLAMAPMAAQAELVEMQDTELAGVHGGQGVVPAVSFNLDNMIDFSFTVSGREIYKSYSIYAVSPTDWEVSSSSEVTSTTSDRYYSRLSYIGNDGGDWYADRIRDWRFR